MFYLLQSTFETLSLMFCEILKYRMITNFRASLSGEINYVLDNKNV